MLHSFNKLPPLPFDVPESVIEKARAIKLAVFDVDGVLTDGQLHYSDKGETIKVFNALDGHGLKMLQQAGVGVAIITARKSTALKHRLNDLKIEHVYMGAQDKVACFNELTTGLQIAPQHCAYVGDDVIDLAVMQQCGLKCSVANGHFIVQHIADWVAPFTGGHGAARAVCDMILYSQTVYPIGQARGQ